MAGVFVEIEGSALPRGPRHSELGKRVMRIVGTDALTPREGPELIVGVVESFDVRGFAKIGGVYRNPDLGRWFVVEELAQTAPGSAGA